MRDRLNVFGSAVCAVSGTAVANADVIENLSSVQTVGYESNVNIVARPSRDIAADETVKVEILECDTEAGVYVTANTYSAVGEVVMAGDPIKFAFPRTTGKYLKVKSTVTKGVATYVSCTVDVAVEIG